MNFIGSDKRISLIEDYYNHFNEDGRLKRRHGQVEFQTNMTYIQKVLCDDRTKKILDIGAGTGAYSVYLDNLGYKVDAIELVPHNIEVFKSKNSKVNIKQGNALDLNMYEDNTFDVTLLFGPMYHLLKEDEKMKALSEAKRVTKPNGNILVSYYMNEYAILTYGFLKQNIIESIKNGSVDENFHVVAKDGDLYSMVRIEDINRFNEILNLKRIKIIASDGASDYIRTPLNRLSDEEFNMYIKYHLSVCERQDLLGASSHLLDILQK